MGGRSTSKAMTSAVETGARRFSVFRFLFFSGFLLRHAVSNASIAVKLTSLAFLSRHGPFSMRPKAVSLLMGKGFNRAKNKQAELAKKLANARQQHDPTNDIKIKQRELFDKLLTSTRGAIPTDMDTNSAFIAPIKAGQGAKKKIQKPQPKTKPSRPSSKEKKEDEKIAQRQFFEALLDMETSKVLGPIGAAQLVPWVPPYLTDCLVVFADPRANSGDLRQTLKYLISSLNNQPDKFSQQIAFITADSIPEMLRGCNEARFLHRYAYFVILISNS